jgi:hypothetical protein
MSHSGVSRYDFGPLFGIDHGDKPKVARAESVAFPTDLDDVAGTPRCRRERGHRGPVNATSCHWLTDQAPTRNRNRLLVGIT